jgi:hypothetical protein
MPKGAHSSIEPTERKQHRGMFPADHDVQFASEAVDRMAATTELQQFVGAWEEALFRLERSWEKAKGEADRAPGHAPKSWLKAMHALRKKDPLLLYLKQARNAETHVVSQTLDAPLRFTLQDRFGRPFHADRVDISVDGSTLVFDVQSRDIGLDWTGAVERADPRLVRFKTRGEWYNPPWLHLGVRLPDMHPVAVATLGVHFYRGAYDALRLGQVPPTSPARPIELD